MTLTQFKDLASGIQSVLIAIAIVVGGLWTIFIFLVQRPDKKAEADLFAQAVLNIAVEAKQVEIDKDGNFYIAAIATIINAGKRTTVLDFKEAPPFRVSKITFAETGFSVGRLENPIAARNVTGTPISAIASEGSDQFHMFVRVPEPGYYYVEFIATLGATDRKIDPNIPAEATSWWGATSVQVGHKLQPPSLQGGDRLPP